jgi:hypothetical protein
VKLFSRRVAWLAAFAVAAASCGGSGGSSGTPTSPSSSAPSTPTSPITPVTNGCGAIGGFLGGVQGIANGTSCANLATTSVVKLILRDGNGQESSGYCSGTVIDRRAVLTAAHCVGSDVASILVYQGTGIPMPAASFSAHPSYRQSGNSSSGLDIGVVITAADLDRTPIPLLFSRDATVGEQAVVAGWGKDENGSSSGLLKAGTTAVSAVTSTWIEAANSGTSANVCSGDSGGPMLLSVGGAWAVGGVTSATSGGTYCTTGISYFANLRNGEAQSFIRGLVPGLGQK